MDPSASGTSKPLIGVIGKGFVGNAVYEGFRHAFDVVAWDTKTGWHCTNEAHGFVPGSGCPCKALVEKRCEAIFVCVPTPMHEDGSCDTSIVTEVVQKIQNNQPPHKFETLHAGSTRSAVDEVRSTLLKRQLVVIKSTVPPGTTTRLSWKFNRLDVCFNPEFLREANAVDDFKNQGRILVGGGRAEAIKVAELYRLAFPSITATQMPSTDAELVKYATNAFLAVKCSFANELAQICDRLLVPYDSMIHMAIRDQRLGDSHWQVPGPDGKVGFGGRCFPKDLNALAACARQLGVKPTMLEAAWAKNLEVRPERDWEQIGGVLSEVKHAS